MKLPRNAQIWGPGLAASWFRRVRQPFGAGPVRVWVCLADHFEPHWQRPGDAIARARVARWREAWPGIARRHRDATGRPAQYTFFYPAEEYQADLLEPLAEMTRDGVADVEVHLHHDRATREGFVAQIRDYTATLHRSHGLLRKVDGQLAFGFIHGNWALDNSRPDGRWCGLNDEIGLLQELGCYADFTMPAAPNPCQSRMVNQIYWCEDDPARPRSHDRGTPAAPGHGRQPGLLMIPGPLALGRHRRWLVAPTLEVGELAANALPSAHRVALWLANAPRVGRDVFLKLHTHGAQDANSALLLEGGLDRLFSLLQEAVAARGWELRHASAWMMAQAVLAAVEEPE